MNDLKCWRKNGCPFNSNNSFRYMKCWQDGYSITQCYQDNGMMDITKQSAEQYEEVIDQLNKILNK